MKHIDPHVHCRDWEQSYKATIRSVTETARSQGIVAFVDMPNTSPSITNEELVKRRLDTARKEGCLEGYYLYIGVTNDPSQIKEAARIAETNPRVAGIKMFAGRSTGSLAITDEKAQAQVYRVLSDAGYEGVLAVHCEKESLFKPELWDPSRPYTWNLARPPEAEVESVRDQIRFAAEAGMGAHLHILHVTVPEAVKLISDARGAMKISCGVTPHHLTISTDEMQDASGLVYKVNPPIREPGYTEELVRLLREGKIDWIETDHAPHAPAEKVYDPSKSPTQYMSGIPSMNSYSLFLKSLSKQGFTHDKIERLTYSNIKNVIRKITE